MSEPNAILLINRDREFLENVCAQLRHASFPVHTAIDMRGALSVLTSEKVGLIICDHALQDVSGYDFLHYLKCDPLRDSIPFIFLVPLNDQGRAFKAFEMGAKDFWVYPLQVEDLIQRVREACPQDSAPAQPPWASPHQEPPARDRRQNERVNPLPPLSVSVSRDGVVWLPGQVMNYSRVGVFLKTALLGKPGLSLQVRFTLPAGATTAAGQIRHIAFDDVNQPGIGLEMEECPEWQAIRSYMESILVKSAEVLNSTRGRESAAMPHKTMVLSEMGTPPPGATVPQGGGEEDSFDLRFYHSLIGKQLDKYKAVSFLGAGNMGGVFKGWDSALERVVAIKVISYKLASQKTFRDMFVEEARTISKLDHPNIARIYDIGDTNNILYFVMEFISGQSLKNLIDRRTNLNTLRGLEYLITVCRALDFVRQRHIIHRDIKPENIMIDAAGTLKIVDFGVAKTIGADSAGSRLEGIVGSPLYMSPDCIAGRALDHRSDIYSLGASFYHAFTGFPPYEGRDADEILLKHLNEKCPPLSEKNKKVARSLSVIVEKMMAKDPADRYQRYTSIIDDLKSLRSRALKFQQLKNSTLILKASDFLPRQPASLKS